MEILAAVIGTAMILLVLWEGFESIILPRRVTRRFRLTRVFYRVTWRCWHGLVRYFPWRLRDALLSFYGPLSILMLLMLWAAGLITGFALLHWSAGSPLKHPENTPVTFLTDLYFSCTTFFTLGLGDVTPFGAKGRLFTMAEAGMGFGFLALIISYFPLLNQSFARREVSISLLDSRAGSPPTAVEMLVRHSHDQALESLRLLLYEWERWSAELMEGHLSYPVLAYFRSQHDNQSWLGALTAILDTCALVRVGLEGTCARQAELTFAMARHAVIDLSLVFQTAPKMHRPDRLPPEDVQAVRDALKEAGLKLREGEEADRKLREFRRLYEPYLQSLGDHFQVAIPPFLITAEKMDNWQVSAWEPGHPTAGRKKGGAERGHF